MYISLVIFYEYGSAGNKILVSIRKIKHTPLFNIEYIKPLQKNARCIIKVIHIFDELVINFLLPN